MNGKKKITKSTNAVFLKRVMEILPLISKEPKEEILRYASQDTDWKVTVRQVETYIARATEIMRVQSKTFQLTAVESAINNLVDLYRKSYEAQDYKLCLLIQKEMNELFGIRVQNLDIKSDGEKISGFVLNITGDEED